ncbi:hypothetical protein [Pseudomonas sp. Irchel s3f7]|uniref:hypothetical protein n=1 Tax=Pseudomonas sp. Irchel s3f7 TaxID=2009153 RepID=UPI000BA4CBFC|nr:hypothetical protein [Pseudomonas sp. Irchel s3f7]
MPLPDDPTPALLHRLNENIMALGCAVEEIGIWIDQRGSTEVSNQINEHLKVLENNSDAIAELLVDLIARWKPEVEEDPED